MGVCRNLRSSDGGVGRGGVTVEVIRRGHLLAGTGQGRERRGGDCGQARNRPISVVPGQTDAGMVSAPIRWPIRLLQLLPHIK